VIYIRWSREDDGRMHEQDEILPAVGFVGQLTHVWIVSGLYPFGIC